MPNGAQNRPTQLDLGPLQNLCRTGSYQSRDCSAAGCAMDEDTRGVVLGLVVIILASVALIAGSYVW
jgi:hypothetical protein